MGIFKEEKIPIPFNHFQNQKDISFTLYKANIFHAIKFTIENAQKGHTRRLFILKAAL